MMSVEDYYKAPPESVFEDIKTNAIKIWDTYDNTYGYRDEKVNRIKDLENISDNAWFIVAMFDKSNTIKLLNMVRPETGKMIAQARGL